MFPNFRYVRWNSIRSGNPSFPARVGVCHCACHYYYTQSQPRLGWERETKFRPGRKADPTSKETDRTGELRSLLTDLGRMISNYFEKRFGELYYVANYRRHPKDGEGTVFTDVCLPTPGRVYPSPMLFPRPLVPGPFQGGYPSPRFFPRSLVPGPFQKGYPSPRFFPRSFLGGGGYLSPGRGTPVLPPAMSKWYPLVRSRCNTPPPPPSQVRMGYPPARSGWDSPPPPHTQERTAERALATRRVVCLLRSRRRTFLWYLFGWYLTWVSKWIPFIITDHVRSTREDNVFTGFCHSVQRDSPPPSLAR